MNIIDYKPKERRIKNKKTLRSEIKKAVKALIVTLSLMIVALAIIFIASTNESPQKGYTLQQAKLKNEQLKTENASITSKVTNSTSFSTIENDEKLKEMQKIEEKTYVTEEDNRIKTSR